VLLEAFIKGSAVTCSLNRTFKTNILLLVNGFLNAFRIEKCNPADLNAYQVTHLKPPKPPAILTFSVYQFDIPSFGGGGPDTPPKLTQYAWSSSSSGIVIVNRRMTRQEILPKVERVGCRGKERERGMGNEWDKYLSWTAALQLQQQQKIKKERYNGGNSNSNENK